VRIRPEAPADREAIAAVTSAAFGKEDEARLVDAIRASDRFVGHLMLSYVDLAARRVLELAPMSVSPDHQRRGVGSALVRQALRRADARGEPIVLGWGIPRTTRASASGRLRVSASRRPTRRSRMTSSWPCH
jgi:putative acetyltransferase